MPAKIARRVFVNLRYDAEGTIALKSAWLKDHPDKLFKDSPETPIYKYEVTKTFNTLEPVVGSLLSKEEAH